MGALRWMWPMTQMVSENIMVFDIDGWHEDGWCHRLLRGRAKITGPGTRFYAEIWIKGEPGNDRMTAASLSVDTGAPTIVDIHRDVPTVLEVDLGPDAAPGQDFTFRLFCENLLVPTGGDARQLSFVLMRMGIR